MANQNVDFTRWDEDVVKDWVTEKLLEIGEDVGHFCEKMAKKNLDSIKNPDTKKDNNYRRYLSNYILTNTVEDDEAGDVLIRVGMKIGKNGQTHHGYWIEVGSKSSQAHPYLRPAVFNNGRDIMKFFNFDGGEL
mgnify:CR=1 FL=1